MKKLTGFFMICVFGVPLLAGTMDSNQFRWPSTPGTTSAWSAAVSQPALSWKSDVAKGIVTIHYTVAAAIKTANLAIYNVNGVMIRDFDLRTGSSMVRWNIARDNVAAGIYIASLRYGNVEKNIQISIVK